VSRQSAAKSEFDMTEETARQALELAFRSPSPRLKIEFQGGEPLLNFPLVRWITAEAKRMNKEYGKELAFVIATNLALLDEEILHFCAEDDVYLSTSLDGPHEHDSSYADIMLSDGLLPPLMESIALSAPMCTTCAFEPYCGADPVFHHATAGDFIGHKALSAFCQRNTGLFTLLLRRMRDDPYVRDLMRRWAQ
jgi:sulfatase maturation enzyme AslB (radical SAM superfamily)